jgi:hypothetical protein
LTDEVRQLILDMPFRKFAQKGFLRHDRDASRVQFAPALWKRLNDGATRARLQTLAETAIATYCRRLTGTDTP